VNQPPAAPRIPDAVSNILVPRPRVSGPGRKERAYQARIAAAERELETAKLLERGTNRLIDRLEYDVDRSRQIERRLSLALGAMQAENQALRARLTGSHRLATSHELAASHELGRPRQLGR